MGWHLGKGCSGRQSEKRGRKYNRRRWNRGLGPRVPVTRPSSSGREEPWAQTPGEVRDASCLAHSLDLQGPAGRPRWLGGQRCPGRGGGGRGLLSARTGLTGQNCPEPSRGQHLGLSRTREWRAETGAAAGTEIPNRNRRSAEPGQRRAHARRQRAPRALAGTSALTLGEKQPF